MTLDEIDAVCCGFVGCEVRYPFESAPDLRAWCIGGKMFAWSATESTPPTIQLKADPEMIPFLIANYTWISPGYHMNKRHWITARIAEAEASLLTGLLEDAHMLVVNKLPRAERMRFLPD